MSITGNTRTIKTEGIEVIFSNTNFKPPKLGEHFNNKHNSREAGRDIESFKGMKAHFNCMANLLK